MRKISSFVLILISFSSICQVRSSLGHPVKFVESPQDTIEIYKVSENDFYIRCVHFNEGILKEVSFFFQKKKLVRIDCAQNDRRFVWLNFNRLGEMPEISSYYSKNIPFFDTLHSPKSEGPCHHFILSNLWEEDSFAVAYDICKSELFSIYEFVEIPLGNVIKTRNCYSIYFKDNRVSSIDNFILGEQIGLCMKFNKQQELKKARFKSSNKLKKSNIKIELPL